MTTIFMQAFFAVRSAHGSMLERARVERGASMVEYALLVALIALVSVAALVLLGPSIAGLFTHANNCVSTPVSGC
jgi:pilus assembly protein Flp/PilA